MDECLYAILHCCSLLKKNRRTFERNWSVPNYIRKSRSIAKHGDCSSIKREKESEKREGWNQLRLTLSTKKKVRLNVRIFPQRLSNTEKKGISLIMLIKRCDFYYMRNSVWSTGINVRNNFLRYDDPCIRCRMKRTVKSNDRITITPLEIGKKRV